MNSQSIRFKLISWYAGLLVVLFVFLGTSCYIGLKYYLKRTIRETLTKRARLIAVTLQANFDRFGETYVIDDLTSSPA